ncbi:hypothetical protein LX77_02544 [Gelidibacter algens]|uniref:HprK-related kinase B n=1 Tax=Gelidibacter algens TaxID=49280 RepID=A0A1A7R1X4_9FLAO|nr:hypothetical protein A9996_09375 [Gelidibacter algens]RAJ22233.1 hypothetical protein LX77_02544 [Gelidibacter algens]
MDVFLTTPNKASFIRHLQRHDHISPELAATYYTEISTLLNSVNTVTEKNTEIKTLPAVPKIENAVHYAFGTTNLKINYGSLKLQNLIHPQYSHTAGDDNKTSNTVVDIFEKDNLSYLFINQAYIGQYSPSEYHLLQGQFSLQLINTLYNKTEADWIATFHASTVCNAKEAIMIIGASGNGKSTLSAVLMAHGFDLLADDFTPLLAETKELYRVPSGISIKEGAFEILEKLYPDFEQYPIYKSTSKAVPIKYIPPAQNFNSAVSHLPCTKIVYVNYDPTATSHLKAVPTEKILETLIPESWLSPLAPNAALFLEWLQELTCYELTYADNAVAVSKFSELFKR